MCGKRLSPYARRALPEECHVACVQSYISFYQCVCDGLANRVDFWNSSSSVCTSGRRGDVVALTLRLQGAQEDAGVSPT